MTREQTILCLLCAGLFGFALEWRFDSISLLSGLHPGISRAPSAPNVDVQWTEMMSHGVVARASNWTGNIPCLKPDEAMMSEYGFRQPATSGFLFLKLTKTAGSTAAGVTMQIAKHTAERNNKDYWICRGRWDHSWAFRMLKDRKRDQSFTWTMLRDPTTRALSEFNHFEVSRKGESASSFVKYVKRKNNKSLYLRELSIAKIDVISNVEAPEQINQILSEYDFFGITERMDESAVALMMLTGSKLGDILYLDAKRSGSFDDGACDNTCYFIQKFRLTPQIRQFLESEYWLEVTKWDNLLYAAANRSLDLTIERLGKATFTEHLSKFRYAQNVAQKKCRAQDVFPCTSTGQLNPHSSCLWSDSGCGYACLKEVADDLDLW